MYISHETKEETEERLFEVLRSAAFKVFEEPYYFKETNVSDFSFDPQALAIVKDDEVWSYLVPATSHDTENFKVFSFHFKDGLDNSGFVGWLASKIKEQLGSGLFVVCGQNARRGGIFDYWGCPVVIETEVLDYINRLKHENR